MRMQERGRRRKKECPEALFLGDTVNICITVILVRCGAIGYEESGVGIFCAGVFISYLAIDANFAAKRAERK